MTAIVTKTTGAAMAIRFVIMSISFLVDPFGLIVEAETFAR